MALVVVECQTLAIEEHIVVGSQVVVLQGHLEEEDRVVLQSQCHLALCHLHVAEAVLQVVNSVVA